jgi:chromosome segregation ATPase
MTRLRARFVGHQAASRASSRRAVEIERSLNATRAHITALKYDATAQEDEMTRLQARFADFRVANKVVTRRAAALDEHVAVLESAMHAGSDYLKALRALTKWRNTIARQAYMTKLDELKAQKSKLSKAAQADKSALRSNGTTIKGLKAQISKLNEAARAN